MNKIFLYGIVTAATLFFTDTACAGVIYNWHQLSSSSTISSSSGQIEITDAAYQSGHLNFGYSYAWDGFTFPNSPLIYFTFGNNTSSPVRLSRDRFVGNAFMDLLFAEGGLITGKLSANDTQTDVYMSAAHGVWNIDVMNSDDPETGCQSSPCYGGTGDWVLDPSSVAVAEPGTPALFGLGLLGIAAALRKRRARS